MFAYSGSLPAVFVGEIVIVFPVVGAVARVVLYAPAVQGIDVAALVVGDASGRKACRGEPEKQ